MYTVKVKNHKVALGHKNTIFDLAKVYATRDRPIFRQFRLWPASAGM